ncbi:MAG: prepilin-type N-terminal cleavage/methylation domain-containing protein [bacterium]|nr:prepilin-type N-terminal cleavage/methylation domain-containing protein [bacterium]
MSKFSIRNQSGDTIVEVLIAVAIISMVLAVAYATMNRNIQTMRDNQERSEAAKLAQGQVEALKQAWGTTTGRQSINLRINGPFCISNGSAVFSGTNTVLSSITADRFNNYVTECRSGFYRFGIRHSAGVFTVYSRWDQLGRNTRGEIVIAYRLE